MVLFEVLNLLQDQNNLNTRNLKTKDALFNFTIKSICFNLVPKYLESLFGQRVQIISDTDISRESLFLSLSGEFRYDIRE